MLSSTISQDLLISNPNKPAILSVDISDISRKYPSKLYHHLISALRLVWSFRNCKSLYFSHTYIGKKLKVSRTYALKLLHILNDEGFIRVYCRQSKTSEYEINPFYLQLDQQYILNRFFKRFFSFNPSLITATSRIVTQLINKGNALIENAILESFVPSSFSIPKSSRYSWEYHDSLAWASDPSRGTNQGPSQPDTLQMLILGAIASTTREEREINKQVPFADFEAMIAY